MPLHITCVCGRLTVVPDETAGHTVGCSRCGRELAIPVVQLPTPPLAPPPTPVTSEVADDEPRIVVDTDPVPRRRGSPDPQRRAVTWVAVLLAVVALLSVVPVLVAQWDPLQHETFPLGERWSLGILLVAILHFVYLIYLLQLPDWSSLWLVSLFLLLITTLYATLLAVRLLSPTENRLMRWLELEGNQFSSAQEAGWCFLMVLITGVASYWAGRLGTQWYRRARARHPS